MSPLLPARVRTIIAQMFESWKWRSRFFDAEAAAGVHLLPGDPASDVERSSMPVIADEGNNNNRSTNTMPLFFMQGCFD
jgi:hypothetical protein